MENTELIELIDKFVSREDVSLEAANYIECAIDQSFPDDDYVQDIVGVLASYVPGGGEYLYNEEQVIGELIKLKCRLENGDL